MNSTQQNVVPAVSVRPAVNNTHRFFRHKTKPAIGYSLTTGFFTILFSELLQIQFMLAGERRCHGKYRNSDNLYDRNRHKHNQILLCCR